MGTEGTSIPPPSVRQSRPSIPPPSVPPVLPPSKDPPPPAHESKLDSVVEVVTGKIGIPLDSWAVAATLESTGMRDVDAVEKYGYPNLFGLAGDVYDLIMKDPPAVEAPPDEKAEEVRRDRWRRFARHLFEGSFFAMPMLGQIACILVTRYSLWASLDFTEMQATLIGLGTVASFAITGGVVMTIGRQGTVYRGMKAYTLLAKVCRRLVALGLVLALLVWVVAAVLNCVVPFLGAWAFATASLYYIALCAMWLSLGLLYMLGKHAWSFGVTFCCGLLVAVQVRVFGLDVEWSQLSSIALASVLAFSVAARTIRKLVPDEDAKQTVAPLPPPDVAAGILAPFAVYGLGYFTFLFADRLIAWTAPGRPLPMPVWFHTPYELGMDWALMSLLVPMAYLEHVIHEFAPRIVREQDETIYRAVGTHRRSMMAFGSRSFVIVVVFSIVSVLVTYWGISALKAFDDVKEIRDFFASDTTEWVFWFAAAGYQLLTWALMVGLLYFTLARGLVVVREMWRCLAVGAVVGFTASRLAGPEWAVLGFTAGTLYFAAGMIRHGVILTKRIDYYYYSAF
ncbi:MAG: hypothetical protein AAGE52_29810 [Myxococcota bacterium]